MIRFMPVKKGGGNYYRNACGQICISDTCGRSYIICNIELRSSPYVNM